MRETSGNVTVNEQAPSQRFSRFVDEKIKDWLRDHDLENAQAEYEVAFYDEDPLGEISCLIVMHADGQLWRSWETADNPRLALRQSLENLHLDEDETALSEQVGERPVSAVLGEPSARGPSLQH